MRTGDDSDEQIPPEYGIAASSRPQPLQGAIDNYESARGHETGMAASQRQYYPVGGGVMNTLGETLRSPSELRLKVPKEGHLKSTDNLLNFNSPRAELAPPVYLSQRSR